MRQNRSYCRGVHYRIWPTMYYPAKDYNDNFVDEMIRRRFHRVTGQLAGLGGVMIHIEQGVIEPHGFSPIGVSGALHDSIGKEFSNPDD